MAKVITTELQHSGSSSVNITLAADGSVTLPADTVDIATLSATGTASSSTYLRGDNAWTAIPASSGPAFRATVASQSIAGDTTYTVEFDTETFDTASCFDTSTHKFTPNKAGYYQVNYHVGFSASNNATSAYVYLQKNDAAYSQISQSNDWCYYMDMTSSDIVYLNGSSDSIRLRVMHNSTGDTFALFDGATAGCYFSAVWIRT
jgi:hypothetical protein